MQNKTKKKKKRKVFVFEIIASEVVALNCLYSADNVCLQQPIC